MNFLVIGLGGDLVICCARACCSCLPSREIQWECSNICIKPWSPPLPLKGIVIDLKEKVSVTSTIL